jgi:hypothetical protein
MSIAWLYLILYLITPFIGSILIYINKESIIGQTIELNFILSYFIHIAIILTLTLIITFFFGKRATNPCKFNFSKQFLTVLLKLIFFSSILTFVLAGYRIFFEGEDRGFIRVNLGILGSIYTWVILYLTPSIVGLATYYVHILNKDKLSLVSKLKYFLILFLALSTAIFTGYKSTFILVLAPYIIIIIRSLYFLKLLLLTITGFLIMLIVTVLTMKMDFDAAFNYIIYRALILTAYGPISVWNFRDNIDLDPIGLVFSIFGVKISSFLTGYDTSSVEFLKLFPTKYISYLAYPDTEAVLEGRVNLTITSFGDAVYILGKDYFFIYSIITGIITGYIMLKLRQSLESELPLQFIMSVIFLINIIIPLHNSGDIFAIFSIPTLIYLFALLIFLNFLLKKYRVIQHER